VGNMQRGIAYQSRGPIRLITLDPDAQTLNPSLNIQIGALSLI